MAKLKRGFTNESSSLTLITGKTAFIALFRLMANYDQGFVTPKKEKSP